MGKLFNFNTNTWRAPLQLIDCWLPAPAVRKAAAANEPLISSTVQRFTRAGWLRRGSGPSSASAAGGTAADAHGSQRVRVLRPTAPGAMHRAGVKLVISGRISDVCAELDRLADQERLLTTRAA